MRCDEGGRTVVCSADVGSEGIKSLTPEGYNARTTVHEYGNGAYVAHDGVVYFSNFEDQCLYSQVKGETPIPLTTNKKHRYANGFMASKVHRPGCYFIQGIDLSVFFTCLAGK